ncbi:nicotinate-nucleotide adenylyltransferase [Thalassotalea aquiviva]|uniref:nicotinate-nucleotide adenylyltransferase n=1 Tax=Thalassotalea aquiviva TaxID=3242415 RepID=UPI00352B3134
MSEQPTNADVIGIFGGTFDPIHQGHIQPILEVAAQLRLNKVFLLPANIPPHKGTPSANSEQRKEMVEEVCLQYPIFALDDRELRRNSPSYTLLTLQEYKAQYPNSTLLFFIGTDSLLTLERWYQAEKLLELCHFVVTTRPGYNSDQLSSAFYQGRLTRNRDDLFHLPNGKIYLAQTSQIDISSTEIRQKLYSSNEANLFVPERVFDYIKRNKLYAK